MRNASGPAELGGRGFDGWTVEAREFAADGVVYVVGVIFERR